MLSVRGNTRRSHFPLTRQFSETAAVCRIVVAITSGCDLRHSQCGHGTGSIINKMTWRFKLVASALVMVVLAMPASALVSCWWHMAQDEHCTPHCPMMSEHAPSVTMQEAPADGSCCQVSAARPTPASMPQAPTGSGAGVTPTLNVSTLDAPVALIQEKPPDPLARASCPSLQSVFCTFLI